MKVTISNGLMLFIALGSLFISNTTWAGYEIKWIAGKKESCYQICNEQGYKPVSSGTYINGEQFYICRANAGEQGYRPGYNLSPKWDDECVTPYIKHWHTGQSYWAKDHYILPHYTGYECLCFR